MADPRHPEGQHLLASPASAADAGAPVPRWGLGDAAVGWVLSYLAAAIFTAIVITAAGYQEQAEDAPLWILGVGNIPLWAGFIGIPIWAAATKGGGWIRDFGARVRPLDVPLGLAIGVAAQLILVPIVSWPILELTNQTSDDLSERAQDLADKATGASGAVLFLVIVGVMAPLAEELFFRGLVLRSFERRIGTWWGLAATSLWFAITHPAPIEFFPLFIVGGIFGYLTIRFGRLGPAVFTHVGFNVTSVVVLLWLS